MYIFTFSHADDNVDSGPDKEMDTTRLLTSFNLMFPHRNKLLTMVCWNQNCEWIFLCWSKTFIKSTFVIHSDLNLTVALAVHEFDPISQTSMCIWNTRGATCGRVDNDRAGRQGGTFLSVDQIQRCREVLLP